MPAEASRCISKEICVRPRHFYSFRYLRHIGPLFAYFSLSLPQAGSSLWTYCFSYTMATG